MKVYCSKCNNIIMEKKKPNMAIFVFGTNFVGDDQVGFQRIYSVEMEIIGECEIKMKCWRKTCRKEHPDHWNFIKLSNNL